MRALFCAGAVLLFMTSAGATAAEPAAKPAEKPVCKRVYDADTGSHFTSSKRICHTALEWKEIEDNNERAMQTLRDHGGISPSSAPGVGSPQ